MKSKIVLAFIIIIFLASRIYKIAQIPPSVYWDEASIGYNAYSIATDLKDEWGKKLPLHFRAFGEFKLPVYIYTTALFVKALGLNEYTVRLPAVFYSLGSLVLVYFLTKKIVKNEWIAVLSAFIFSVSPWWFIFSRTGYEATAGLFFFLLGTYLFLYADKNKYFIPASILGFMFSFYSYNSFRIIIPIWIIFLLIYKFKSLLDIKKSLWVLIFSFLVFIISLIPVYRLYKFDAGGARFVQVEASNKMDIIKNYFSHFSPQFLFFKGDSNPRSQMPGHGELYLYESLFILAGFFAIVKQKNFIYLIPLVMLLAAPIPASLTKESPHALRSILMAPAFAIISAIGVDFLMKKFNRLKKPIIFLITVAYGLSFGSYFLNFITKYSAETATDWQYEYKKIFTSGKTGKVNDKYGQPYIFALYYLKYPPEKFRREVKYNPVSDWGFSTVASFDGFKFVK